MRFVRVALAACFLALAAFSFAPPARAADGAAVGSAAEFTLKDLDGREV